MHGVKRRVKSSEEKERERKEAELKRIQQFIQITDQTFSKRAEKLFDVDLLSLATRILELNPEFYTAWNLRRQIFQALSETKTSEELEELYETELRFIEQAIVTNPKSYWVWLHREWITSRKAKVDWPRELKLCGKLLALDERNFHCWNYRRYASKQANSTLKEEFDFTTKKIEDNFSNYSAWHNRSAILTAMYVDNDPAFKEALDREFELVQNAFYTEPGDQSAWFYHRWLIDRTCGTLGTAPLENSRPILERELKMCQDLLQVEPNSKWAILTITLLMGRLGGHKEAIASHLKHLVELDPLRANYYSDIAKNYS